MPGESSRLLVVDDDEPRRARLSDRLTDLGYSVTTAQTVDQALDRARSAGLDLLLVHAQSSRVNVYQLLVRLTEGAAPGGPPILVLGHAESQAGIAKCLELGASDWAIESDHPALLRSRIEACLDRARLGIQLERGQAAQQRALEALEAGEKYERDVQIGRQIQASFLPAVLPELPGWDLAARFEPARQVAGDWYDAFMLPHSRRLGLVMADVCDKGVGAALFMGLMRSLIRAFAQQPTPLRWMDTLEGDTLAELKTPAERRRALPTVGSTALRNAIEQTNNYVSKTHADTNMFATIFFGLLDPATGTLQYINGGHEAPVIIDASGALKARLPQTGLAVGMLPDAVFQIASVRLAPGDLLIAYTDGVPDARNPERQFYTEERFLKLVTQPPVSAAATLDQLLDSVRAHIAQADQYDDVTLLALRRLPGV